MCGIVGYVGKKPAVDFLIRGLKRLEYRGYDSTGVAYFAGPAIEIVKSEGKLTNVEDLIHRSRAVADSSHCGIGHTRWATHGKPTTQNAHPHRTGHVVLVHNGIIENYRDIRKDLETRGHRPISETDSELLGFLILEEMESGKPLREAVRASFRKVEGACSIVVMSEKTPGILIGVRNGSPLVVTRDPEGGVAFASDAQPLLELSQDVTFLDHGDVVEGDAGGFKFFDLTTGMKKDRPFTRIDWTADQLDRGGYAHYMLKEIYEQPAAWVDTFNALVDRGSHHPFVLADQPGVKILEGLSALTFAACGTSFFSSMIGKYWFEIMAKLPTRCEFASEIRYASPAFQANEGVIGITQSGETADVLAVAKQMKDSHRPMLALTNVRNSSISREAQGTFYKSAGPEIGVAATKTFTCQLISLLSMAGHLARVRKTMSENELRALFDDMAKLPHVLNDLLTSEFDRALGSIAESIQGLKAFFFIGRGLSYPVALEGALKLKEIAYVHAEGYAAGELKHGPIAMIDPQTAVIVLAPKDRWREKTVSNLEEVRARGARIVGVGDPADGHLRALSEFFIPLPKEAQAIDEKLLPLLLAPVVQLLSYKLALLKGTDIDKPRNLAKSVTVE